MAKPPAHLRISLIGDMPDGEMFSCNLNARVIADAFPDPGFQEVVEAGAGPLGQDSPFEHVRNAAVAFWARAATQVSNNCVLRRVKLAAIDNQGHYMGPAAESAENVPGGLGDNLPMFPHQVARKITLETDGDLSRIKGGFYLPGCTNFGFNEQTDLYDADKTGELRDSVVVFLQDIAYVTSMPGDEEIIPVVASGGRYNANGSQRVAPALWEVKRVNVGRRADVQRRRANKLSEARITDAAPVF